MPAEQTHTPAKADKPAAFPARITLHLTTAQADALDQLCNELNAASRAAGKGKPYSVNPMIRAAIAMCIKDDRLRPRMVKLSRTPEHTGRPQ